MARKDIHTFQWLGVAKQSSFSANLLSKELNVSRRQLQRYTQALFGRSPQEWLHQQRMDLAGDLLREQRSAKAVAAHLGFKQLSHFSREFKLRYGLSPRAFLTWTDRQGPNAA
jgi:AraC-like DNA-binding protein